MVSNWAIDWRLDVGCWMLDVRCSQGFMERFPRCKTSRIEPLNRSLNRRKTSNTQHPTSNNQWFPIGPLIGGWVLDVGCSMFPRVHGEEAGLEEGENSPKNSRIEPMNRRKTSNTQRSE